MGSCCCRSARATGRASWTRWRHRGCGAGDREAGGHQRSATARPGRSWTGLDPATPAFPRKDGLAGRPAFQKLQVQNSTYLLFEFWQRSQMLRTVKYKPRGPHPHLALVRQQHRIGRGLTNAPGSGDEGRQTGGRPDQGSGVRSWTSADLGAHPALPAHQLAFSEPPLCLGVFCRAVPTS